MNADSSLDRVISTSNSEEEATLSVGVEIAGGVPSVCEPTVALETEKLTEEPIAARSLEGAFGEALAFISEELTELRNKFATKIEYDESKQRQLDLMHQELEQHRRGMVTQIMRPILMDLISMYDDLSSLVEGNPDQEPQVVSLLRNQLQSIGVILGRYGVDIYSSSDDTFDRARQRVLSVVDTSNEMLDQRVARRLRVGFSYDGRTLRPELVETYRYRQPRD